MSPVGWGVLWACVVALQSGAEAALREGAALEDRGDSAGALGSYGRAVAESAPASNVRGRTLMALASVRIQLGQYSEGQQSALEAAAVFEQLGDLAATSHALNSAGLSFLYQGKYQQAEPHFRRAIELSTRAGDAARLAEQLGNLGNVQFFLGDYSEAAGLNDQALEVTAKAGDALWASRRRRILLVNKAILHQRVGRDRQALAIYESLGTAAELRHNEQAQLLVNRGVLYRRLGDPVKALEMYDAARAMFARERNVAGELGVLTNRGIVLALDLGRLDEAARNFTAALESATATGNRRQMLHAHLYRAETLLLQNLPARAREDYSAGLSLARELKTPEEEWKALYGLGRTDADPAAAVVHMTEAIGTFERLRENIGVPSLRSDFLNDKRQVYDALLARRVAAGSAAEIFGLLERSHSRGWRERLGLTAPVDLGSVQRALPPRTLLLEYWNSAAGSAVVAVTHDRAEVIPLALDAAALKRYADTLAAAPSATRDATPSPSLLPDAGWFENIDQLIVVTDGAVALVPFDLLNVSGRPLVETVAVSYTLTAATLLRPARPVSAWLPPWRLQLRAFATGTSAAALPATAEEVLNISRELAGRARLYVGADNRKAHLLSTAERAPILHLATHATSDVEAMEGSRILFSPNAEDVGETESLFLREAYDLPLDGVELAVLSACETARGRVARGEGVQSFSRAFLSAGARSTVTTLWRVADAPTAEFMKVFYHHLQRGEPRAEALRRAKLSFLRTGDTLAHPHYWAAFVLTGEGQAPVPRAFSWTLLIAAAAGGLMVVAFSCGYVRRQAIRL